MTASLFGDTLEYAWRIEAGERERLSIPVLDEDGSAANLTGFTIDAKIKTAKGSGVVLYAFPPEHITVSAGTVTLLIPGPVSAAWYWTVGWWRMVITAPNPNPLDPDSNRVIQGPFVVDPD